MVLSFAIARAGLGTPPAEAPATPTPDATASDEAAPPAEGGAAHARKEGQDKDKKFDPADETKKLLELDSTKQAEALGAVKSKEDLETLSAHLEEKLKDDSTSDPDKQKLKALKGAVEKALSDKRTAEAAAEAAPIPLKTTGSKINYANGKKGEIFDLGNEKVAWIDGRKTVTGEPLIVVGGKDATMMDGVFPASAFGLVVKDGALAMDPSGIARVSSHGGMSGLVPVIFDPQGNAYARMSGRDESGAERHYWTEKDGSIRSVAASSSGGNTITVGDKLPSGLHVPAPEKEGGIARVMARTEQSDPTPIVFDETVSRLAFNEILRNMPNFYSGSAGGGAESGAGEASTPSPGPVDPVSRRGSSSPRAGTSHAHRECTGRGCDCPNGQCDLR